MVVTDARLSDSQHTPRITRDKVLEEICRARDGERRRLSAELHDGVVQWMVGALYRMKAFNRQASPWPHDDLKSELINIESTLQRSVRELRRIIADLCPLPLEELGLVPALRQAAAACVEEGITCHFKVGALPELTLAEETATFRIIQEALANVRKHSGATIVHLRLWSYEGLVSAKVTDNGRGFDPEEAITSQLRPGHIGLLGMKDRADLIGARLSVDSHPGKGTSVSFVFPPASQHAALLTPRR